jgi:hypothetical protein
MGKGYAEGPAAEERFEAMERGEGISVEAEQPVRHAVYGSTADDPTKHFLGWVDEVDAEQLFTSGQAYGIKIRRIPA